MVMFFLNEMIVYFYISPTPNKFHLYKLLEYFQNDTIIFVENTLPFLEDKYLVISLRALNAIYQGLVITNNHWFSKNIIKRNKTLVCYQYFTACAYDNTVYLPDDVKFDYYFIENEEYYDYIKTKINPNVSNCRIIGNIVYENYLYRRSWENKLGYQNDCFDILYTPSFCKNLNDPLSNHSIRDELLVMTRVLNELKNNYRIITLPHPILKRYHATIDDDEFKTIEERFVNPMWETNDPLKLINGCKIIVNSCKSFIVNSLMFNKPMIYCTNYSYDISRLGREILNVSYHIVDFDENEMKNLIIDVMNNDINKERRTLLYNSQDYTESAIDKSIEILNVERGEGKEMNNERNQR